MALNNLTAKTLLQRMPEVFNTEAAGDTRATIQYDLAEPMYQVLDNGTLQVHEGRADNPDLTITMSDDDLLELFRGNLNGMTAFMTGRVKIEGDMMLAQRLVGFVDQEKMSALA
ncbi:SCP2 sterol-binding domain-containing protein [soil metagenome]